MNINSVRVGIGFTEVEANCKGYCLTACFPALCALFILHVRKKSAKVDVRFCFGARQTKNMKNNFERCMHHRFLFVVLEDLAYVCLHYSEHNRQCLHQSKNRAISILLCEVKYVLPQHSHLKK